MGHLNARSVCKHFYEIERILRECKFDVVGVSETFLKIHSPKNLCTIAGFKFFRNDRSNAAGGGVGIFVREELNPKLINLPQKLAQPEMIFLEVQFLSTRVSEEWSRKHTKKF